MESPALQPLISPRSLSNRPSLQGRCALASDCRLRLLVTRINERGQQELKDALRIANLGVSDHLGQFSLADDRLTFVFTRHEFQFRGPFDETPLFGLMKGTTQRTDRTVDG